MTMNTQSNWQSCSQHTSCCEIDGIVQDNSRAFSLSHTFLTLHFIGNSPCCNNPFSGRWMTDKERLAALQFPVYPQMREAGQFRHEMKLESNAIKHLSGNAWHAGNASLVLLTALSCAKSRY